MFIHFDITTVNKRTAPNEESQTGDAINSEFILLFPSDKNATSSFAD